jgi:uncharacterized protein (DUF433 family)
MSAPATSYGHVFMHASGRPCIGASAMKVVQLVAEQTAHGWSAEELHFQHAGLSLAQIHSALAYYWDHAQELDAVLEAQLREIAERVRTGRPSPLEARLRTAGPR